MNLTTYKLTTNAIRKPAELKESNSFSKPTRSCEIPSNWELLSSICCYLFASLIASGSDWLWGLARIKIHFMPQEAHHLTSAEQSHWPQTLHQLPFENYRFRIRSRQRWQHSLKVVPQSSRYVLPISPAGYIKTGICLIKRSVCAGTPPQIRV